MKPLRKIAPYTYFVFRAFLGLLFLGHGLMKFGMLGGKVSPIFTLMWYAGAIEILVGLLVTVGLFGAYAGLLGAVEMVFAYFMAHYPKGVSPYGNGGELAILYMIGFLAISAKGSGEFSLDRTIFKK
ncbi:MAG: DoxX family protein [Nanoarchaeota archaeon]|nr:DoxX family protein [Nanoarchaeota archaeon]